MAKTCISLLLALVTLTVLANDSRIITQSPGSITFEVDENLKPVNPEFELFTGGEIAKALLSPPGHEDIRDYRVIATSFANENNLDYLGESVFYGTLVTAYANHMSVTLSPDMVWLLISQGFARYVNAHAKELRPLLVSHTGKMELNVTGEDYFFENADWPKLIGEFASQTKQFAKGGIAQVITADLSTTGAVERVASQITLMKSMENNFVYEFVYGNWLCGIPSITLMGTPEDWRHVLEKTKKLSQYSLDGWVEVLEPILTEFIRAAEGHPNQRFWQCIVKNIQKGELSTADGCGDDTESVVLDGWFLKLFLEGQTIDAVQLGVSMGSEMVHVEFQYRMGKLSVPMELWAGFIATEVDTAANMLIPKIGWMVVLNNDKWERKEALLYTIMKHWALFLCLTVLALSILGFLGRKVIKSRKRRK